MKAFIGEPCSSQSELAVQFFEVQIRAALRDGEVFIGKLGPAQGTPTNGDAVNGRLSLASDNVLVDPDAILICYGPGKTDESVFKFLKVRFVDLTHARWYT